MNYFCKMVNKMNENFKHVFKFAHQPIYYNVFFPIFWYCVIG